jgi:serine/threonine protein kinase
MAKVIAIGNPENDDERKAIAYLRDHLPNSFTIIHNFELRQRSEAFEIDLAILGPHGVCVVDVKGTRGQIDVYGSKWYPEGRAPYHSPLAILRKHAKVLKSIICDQERTVRGMGQLYVDAVVILTAPDANLIDPDDIDKPNVVHLAKSSGFLQDPNRVPSGFTRDAKNLLSAAQRAIVGRAKPRAGLPCYGNWQIIDRLGGTDRYTEYRAKHVLLGDRRGGTARLRVYQVDSLLAEDEWKQQRDLISNAFRSVGRLPGHPNVLTVREFLSNESKDRLVLVMEDVPGQALRQHMKKVSLALTYDQKISVIRDVLSALDHAHRSDPQVIHRNLTPDAILVSSTGRALLGAFDYARAGRDRASTIAEDIVDDVDPMYQAPECYRDPAQASVPSDLYSAGFVFYELLVGEPPFSSVDDLMDKDGKFPVKPSEIRPELPVAIDDWLQRLCAFDAEDRYPSAAVAREQFNNIVGPDPRQQGEKQPEAKTAKASPTSAADYADLPQGYQLGRRFRIEEQLGRGGFAVAYKAFDSFSDTNRVLKLVVKDRRSTFERLKQEYKALLQLPDHPNVVKVVWADQLADETPYIVFEYLPGSNVEELVNNQAISLEDALKIARETSSGLKHIHENGVFHRDIKPSNLIWSDDGVRIIDFNVAVRKDDEEQRQGGTRRYLPPDKELGESQGAEDEVDRDLYALGITLYECASGGKYPWEGPTPKPGAKPRPLVELQPDIHPDFSTLVERAIAPRQKDRFGSMDEFLSALGKVEYARRTAPPKVKTPPKELTVLETTKPDFNPFVDQMLSMYSQSSRSNAGTRGLDDIGRQTYVDTRLDSRLKPDVLAGSFGLVIISGNAGDGKTAFIQTLEEEPQVKQTLNKRVNGSAFTIGQRRFITNYDGSQDEEDKRNDQVLKEFFGPFSGTDDKTWPTTETRIIAINEGRLVDFLTQNEAEYGHLASIVQAGLGGAAPVSRVVVVNLNLRTVVASSDESDVPDSIFDRLVQKLTDKRFWEPCLQCDLRDRCYIYHNVRTLQDPTAGPKVVERLEQLYVVTHLRGRLHITMRDLRSALAFTIAGTKNCHEVHALYGSSNPDSRSEILNGFYFNSWKGRENGADRLLRLLQEIDIAEVSNPDIDRSLDYRTPDAWESARFSLETRTNYDAELFRRLYEELPRDANAGADWRAEKHAEYVGMLRRRHYFERRDSGWQRMIPYTSATEFWDLVRGRCDPSKLLDPILTALNRGEGLSDPKRLGNTLALRVRTVEKGTVRSYRLFPGEEFRLELPAASEQEYLEFIPQSIVLAYESSADASAALPITLDIFEMLQRLNRGYRPNLEELHGYYLSLSVFKNVLASAPYQEVMVTRTGYDFFKIRRAVTGQLHLEPLKVGEVA